MSEPLQQSIGRILDEESAWIARPSDVVTRRIALAAAMLASNIEVDHAECQATIDQLSTRNVWIVEAVPKEGRAVFRCAGAAWTSSAWEALHFVRKRDAEAVANHVSETNYPGNPKEWHLRVVSHSFDMSCIRDEL